MLIVVGFFDVATNGRWFLWAVALISKLIKGVTVFLKEACWFINEEVLSLLGDYLSICPEPPQEDRVPELESAAFLLSGSFLLLLP